MAKIKATIGGVAYEINAVKGITANNTEINVPLTIDGEGGGVGGYTEANTVVVDGNDLTLESVPVLSSPYTGIKIAHGLSVAPRLIIVTSDAVFDGSLKGIITGGLFTTDKAKVYKSNDSSARYAGVLFTTNINTGAGVSSLMAMGSSLSPIVGYDGYGADETYFYTGKSANNQNFSTDLTYTFLFLA